MALVRHSPAPLWWEDWGGWGVGWAWGGRGRVWRGSVWVWLSCGASSPLLPPLFPYVGSTGRGGRGGGSCGGVERDFHCCVIFGWGGWRKGEWVWLVICVWVVRGGSLYCVRVCLCGWRSWESSVGLFGRCCFGSGLFQFDYKSWGPPWASLVTDNEVPHGQCGIDTGSPMGKFGYGIWGPPWAMWFLIELIRGATPDCFDLAIEPSLWLVRAAWLVG